MKIYIEKDGEFYAFTDWDIVKNYPEFELCDGLDATDKRNFEIGARVYFEDVGWTEVVTGMAKTRPCNYCFFDGNKRCGGECMDGMREDKTRVYFRKLAEEKHAPDAVEHPSHYADTVPGIECIQVTQHFNFNRGNAIKYIWRAGVKNPEKEIEDIQKAIQYLGYEIERLKK